MMRSAATQTEAAHFRRVFLIGVLCSVLLGLLRVSTVQAQALGSGSYVPESEQERALLDRASRKIFPHEARIGPAKDQSPLVVWTGLHLGRLRSDRPVLEHHYFDFAVEGDATVWLSPFGEGDFCLVGLAPSQRAELARRRNPFVVVYGTPVMLEGEACLEVAYLRVTDFRWTTMVIEYGPNGDELDESWMRSRQVVKHHPEEEFLVPFGYRAQAMIAFGEIGFDLDDFEGAWAADLEVSRRLSLRNEVAATIGIGSCFGDATCLPLGLLYRRYVVGTGVAAGPIAYVPLEGGASTWLGLRYAPSMGDALGDWGRTLVASARYDVLRSSEGWAFMAHLSFGIDGNWGRAP